MPLLSGGGICHASFTAAGVEELWRHTEQRGYYTCLQSTAGATLRELGIEHEEFFGEEAQSLEFPIFDRKLPRNATLAKQLLVDRTIVFDCIELFSGQGNWSKSHAAAGLKVHPGIERAATGNAFGDLADDETFRKLALLAHQGAIREWHAGPPCWSFGTLRRPRLRSKELPAGFRPNDPKTLEQTMLAVRTAFLLTLAVLSGSFISVEQPGGSVMFRLAAFLRLLELGCQVTKFCFCSFGSGFNKPSKWLHNKPRYRILAGKCTCNFKNRRFTVQGSFTSSSIKLFNDRCTPDAFSVYGRVPQPGEAVSSFSASCPIPLCQVMATGSRAALTCGAVPDVRATSCSLQGDHDTEADRSLARMWYDDPQWVEDICESMPFQELFRFRFKKGGHINCLECRTYKSWLKHCSKKHPNSRILGLLDSRVTMGAAAKGRSSSQALSRILRSSLGYIIGGGLYPGTLHCRSAWNRADGPSRDREVRGPSRPLAPWLVSLQAGDAAPFDEMVALAKWSRPVGRWIRLLLLMAGDVDRTLDHVAKLLLIESIRPEASLICLAGLRLLLQLV